LTIRHHLLSRGGGRGVDGCGERVARGGGQDSVWDNHTRARPLQLLYRSPLIAVSTLDARE